MEQNYKQQLSAERSRNTGLNVEFKLADRITRAMTKAVEDGDSWVWPFAFLLAAFNDGIDLLAIGAIPILGDALDATASIILTGLLWNIGGFIKWKVRGLVWLAAIMEIVLGLVIIPEFFPFWIVCIAWAYWKVKEQSEIAKEGIKNYEKGKINKNVLEEFA